MWSSSSRVRRIGPVNVLQDEEQAALARRSARAMRRRPRRGEAWPAPGRRPARGARRGRAAERAARARAAPRRARRRAGRCPGARGSCRRPRPPGGKGARTQPRRMRPRGPPSRAVARGLASSVARRVLPIPASPPSATKRLSPRCAVSSASSRTKSWSCLPIRVGQRTRLVMTRFSQLSVPWPQPSYASGITACPASGCGTRQREALLACFGVERNGFQKCS